jgi:hypothetical protein
MWYMIVGLALPLVMTLLLALIFFFAYSIEWFNVWMYILLIDPFWPLAQSLVYIINYQIIEENN